MGHKPISNIDLVFTENLGGPQMFNFTDSIDSTYFSGTPNYPDGGDMSEVIQIISLGDYQ